MNIESSAGSLSTLVEYSTIPLSICRISFMVPKVPYFYNSRKAWGLVCWWESRTNLRMKERKPEMSKITNRDNKTVVMVRKSGSICSWAQRETELTTTKWGQDSTDKMNWDARRRKGDREHLVDRKPGWEGKQLWKAIKRTRDPDDLTQRKPKQYWLYFRSTWNETHFSLLLLLKGEGRRRRQVILNVKTVKAGGRPFCKWEQVFFLPSVLSVWSLRLTQCHG